ncbi:MAG: 4Fe-4S binding protein, partial [Blastocatellia bacterium]
PLEGGTPEEGTLIIDMRSAIANAKLLAARKPDAGTGLLTGVLPALDEQALNVFWEKRKREAGKIAEKTLLHPKGGGKVGKARFNWRPTMDLRHLWRKSYFYWGGAAVAVISIAAILVPGMYYSPGDLSTAHYSGQPSAKGIALNANGNSCSNCHSITSSMQQSCKACHTTQTFKPVIYDAHVAEGMQCTSCHTEHLGSNDQMGLITYGICSSCHNGIYKIKAEKKAGQILPIPHGGGVGYPVVDHKWTWKGLMAADWKKLGLPEQLATQSSQQQFHLVHQLGKMSGRMRCTDCHVNGTPQGNQTDESPRNECAKCHGITYEANSPVKVTANCNTCHQQHGESIDLAKLVPSGAGDFSNIKKYIDGLTTGGADNQGSLAPIISTSVVGGAATLRQEQSALKLGAISSVGAVPWYGWAILVSLLPVVGFVVIGVGTARRRSFLRRSKAPEKPAEKKAGTTRSIDLEKLKAEGPAFPHPVIDTVLCIGCHACVEACPHDVLAIVNGVSTPVALDQCMEDTSCQVECPTNPKA